MSFKIPQPIVQYNNPLAVQPSRSYVEPSEGKSFIPIELDWPGNKSTFQINVQGIGTKPFSQIVMLDVDNTQSGAAVTFYFSDSTDTLVVPAESSGLFPVFTNSLLFYAAAPAALASDVTRVRILNYRQEPVGLPPPEAVTTANQLGVALLTGTTALIPAGTSGTLVGYTISMSGVAGAGNVSIEIELVDHATASVIDAITMALGNAQSGSVAISPSGLAVRFSSGLDIVVSVSGTAVATGGATVSAKYRTP